jgi:cysteinyl-tRNA synthetase
VKLRNTYSRSLEAFVPLDPDRVTMYTCGPTVYSFAHIGNFRSFLFADVLRRVLERRGFAVRQVMNITDVGHMTEDHLADATGEDKLAKAARELGTDPFAVAAHFEREFVRDATSLRLRIYQEPDASERAVHPRATEYIPQMVDMVKRLVERGFAYLDASGQVYFEIAKFPTYGELSGKPIDQLEAGARVAVREEKRDPRDFALWKVDAKHLMQWDAPPFGRGFPGWHIECSAMSKALLGDTIDIHTGGDDNIFPHHECEIAQSCCADDVTTPAPDGGPPRVTFARYWIHGRHLLVDGKKMSKRDGTFFTVRDLLAPSGEVATKLAAEGFASGVPAAVLRLALISSHHGHQLNFTFDLLGQASATVTRLQSLYDRLCEDAADGPVAIGALLAEHLARFDAALDDDLDMPNALAAVLALVKALNVHELGAGDARAALAAIDGIDRVLDVLDRRPRSGKVTRARLSELVDGDVDALLASELEPVAIERLAGLRHAAKARKDFATADRIRAGLRERGVELEDVSDGVRWRLSDRLGRSSRL